MAESEFLNLVNALLHWEEGAHEVLGDYLEEAGFERQFHEQGGLYHQAGVVVALIQIGAMKRHEIDLLLIPESQKARAVELLAQDDRDLPGKDF